VLQHVVMDDEADRPQEHGEDHDDLDRHGVVVPDSVWPDREPASSDAGHAVVHRVPEGHPCPPQARDGEERVEEEDPPHRAHGGDHRGMDLLSVGFGEVQVGGGHPGARDEGDHEDDHPHPPHPFCERPPPLEGPGEEVRPQGHREAGASESGYALEECTGWVCVGEDSATGADGHEPQRKRTQRGHDEPPHRSGDEPVLELCLGRPAEREVEERPDPEGSEGGRPQRPQGVTFSEYDRHGERPHRHRPDHQRQEPHVPEDDREIVRSHVFSSTCPTGRELASGG